MHPLFSRHRRTSAVSLFGDVDGSCPLLQQDQDAPIVRQRCPGVSLGSEDRDHRVTSDPWWASSPLCAGLGFRYTHWFEFRVGQNSVVQRQTEAGLTTRTSGLQDLYLGFKVAVTEQHGALPAIAVIPQMTVPTGSVAVTAGRVMPGVNLDFSWEVIKDVFSIEVLVANNIVRDGLFNARHELATGLTGTFNLTKNLEAFVEWDAFYPNIGIGPAGPRHYAVAGLVYYFTSNLAADVRAGVGLSDRSDDFLAGLGFAVRF